MGDTSPTDLALPHVEGVEHRFVDANGLRMHVAEAGAPEADPVVLLHGWPQHWYMWRDVIAPLAERYRVICPDLRGLGWSDAPPGGYEKENLATDVLALLDELGLERVRLAGHDFGGWIGFLICLREPTRIERFLALSIVPPFLRVTPRMVVGAWRFWYQWLMASPLGAAVVSRSGGRFEGAVGRWVGAEIWSDEERESFLGQFVDPARARASVQYYRTFVLREQPWIAAGRYRRTRLRVPTRILFGTGEKAMSDRWLEGCERFADQLEVELVPGAGHFIVDERPELVVERARELFAPDRDAERIRA
jgi:pimeloyl-ACP methyl ester carboxylesterase